MAVTVHDDKMLAKAREEGAKRLLRAAVYFVEFHKRQVGISNPRPYLNSSKPGEYPRKRTGMGQAGVVYGPTNLGDISRDMKIRIGQLVNARHMLILEFGKERLGFLRTAKDLKDAILLILGTK